MSADAQTSHNIKVNLGFLNINIDQDRITPLLMWMHHILPPSPNASLSQENEQNQLNPKPLSM